MRMPENTWRNTCNKLKLELKPKQNRRSTILRRNGLKMNELENRLTNLTRSKLKRKQQCRSNTERMSSRVWKKDASLKDSRKSMTKLTASMTSPSLMVMKLSELRKTQRLNGARNSLKNWRRRDKCKHQRLWKKTKMTMRWWEDSRRPPTRPNYKRKQTHCPKLNRTITCSTFRQSHSSYAIRRKKTMLSSRMTSMKRCIIDLSRRLPFTPKSTRQCWLDLSLTT